VRVPIPDDFTGEWECFSVYWPKSDKWNALLMGFLSYAMRGRFWDEKTGNVKGAIDIGWQIWGRNNPLYRCSRSPECPRPPVYGVVNPPSSSAVGSGDLSALEDEDMGQVVTDVTVENGVLTVWFGPCCSKTLSDFMAAHDDTVPDDPLNPSHVPEYVYSACGKAWGVVNVVYKIIESAYDAVVSAYVFPWQLIHAVESDVGYDLDNNWLIAVIVNAALGVAIGMYYDDIASDVEKQNIVCALAQFFTDDAAGVPDAATFEQIKGIFRAEISPLNWQIYDQAINALGQTDMDTVAKLSAAETDADCECPGVSGLQDPTPSWSGTTWSHFWDFTAHDVPDFMEIDTAGGDFRYPGQGVCCYPNDISGGGKVSIKATIDQSGGTVTHVYMLLQVVSVFDYNSANSKIYTAQNKILDKTSPSWNDTDPSIGGQIIVQKIDASEGITVAGDQFVGWQVEGNNPEGKWDDTYANAIHVLSIAIGGTGTDPFSDW